MKLRKCRYIAALMVAFTALCVSSCGGGRKEKPSTTTTSGIINVYCDQSFQNIMDQEIDVFEFTYPKASIVPYYLDQSAVIDSLNHGATNVAIIARDMTKDQREYLKHRNGLAYSYKLAVDAIALIVNKDNNVDELTVNQLRDIFTGKIKRWSQIKPNTKKNDSIIVVFDNQGSSTVRYMQDSLMNGKPFIKNVYAQKTSKDVFEAVKKRKNAIGIIGVSWITTDMRGEQTNLKDKVNALQSKGDSISGISSVGFSDAINVLSIRRDGAPRGYKPYQAYIYSGDYPFYRTIYAVCCAANGSLGHGFYTFITGFIGQKIIQTTGVLPARMQARFVELE